MIATKKVATLMDGAGYELLADLSCIVEALKKKCGFSNALIMDYVKAGLGEYPTAEKILEELLK